MFIKNLIEFVKVKRVIKNIVKNENLLDNFSNIFSTDNYRVKFKQDWIGRIYAVVNPTVADPENRIFEYNLNSTDVKSFVNKWIMERMVAIDTFVKNNLLFDLLSYEIKQLDSNYNFLLILTPITWPDFKRSLRNFSIVFGILLIIVITLLFVFL